MTQRKCAGCGVPEQRWRDKGQPCVNLDPFLNLCVDCLIAYAKENPRYELPRLHPVSDRWVDSRARQSGDTA